MHDGPGRASRRQGDGSFVSPTILAREGTLVLLVPLRGDWEAPMI
jgi:hypothetical protein